MKKLFFWIILFVVGITLPLLALEAAGRMYMSLKFGVEGKSYGLWKGDAELGAIHNSNAYNSYASTNNLGFRNNEQVEVVKSNNLTRIIVYGGSTTFCYNLSNEDAWPNKLQSRLRDDLAKLPKQGKTADKQIEVLNAGAILWSIGHAYARAKRDIPKLKPDYVLIYSGINEMGNNNHLRKAGTPLIDSVKQGEYGKIATNFDQSRWLKRNSVLLRFFDYRIKPILLEMAPDKAQQPRVQLSESEALKKSELAARELAAIDENYRNVLVNFLKLIIEHDAKPIFIVQAHSTSTPQNKPYTDYSRRAAKLAEENGAIVLDAQDVVRNAPLSPEQLFSESGIHFSTQGAKLLSDYIADNIEFH